MNEILLVCSILTVCLLPILHRPNDSWRTGFEHLPVSVSFPKWTEVARCPSHRFLCPEHAAGADPLVETRGAAEAAAADGLRPQPHRQSEGPLRCVV